MVIVGDTRKYINIVSVQLFNSCVSGSLDKNSLNMNKFWLVRVLSVVTGIQRGPYNYILKPKSKLRFAWILSPYALWSLFLFWFSIYRITSDIAIIMNSNVAGPPAGQQPQISPEVNSSLENQPEGRRPGRGGTVVVFALSAYSISTYCTTILLRFGALIYSPIIIQIIHRVEKMCDGIESKIYTGWSWNEILMVGTCCISQAWRNAQSSFDATDTPRLRERRGSLFDTSSVVVDFIVYNLSALNSEGFPLEVTCIGLIIFVMTMARIIELKCEGSKCKLRKQSYPHTLELFLESDIKSRTSTPDYGDKLEEFYQSNNAIPSVPKDDQRLWELVDHYSEWYLLWMRDAEQGVGFMLLVIFLHFTLSLCLSFFIAITSTLDNGLFSFISLRNIFGVVILFIKMICLGTAAHYLQESCSKLKEQIIKTHWENETKEEFDGNLQFVSVFYKPISGRHSEGISLLIGFIKENPLCLSALGYFTVTRSTVTNIANVIVTYLVILLQFRESPASE